MDECLRFGHWLTLCTINIYLLTYLLTNCNITFYEAFRVALDIVRSQHAERSSTQKRAMNIIFPGYKGLDYKTLLTVAGVGTLCSRRQELTRRFFVRHVQNETCCLNNLLPPKRDRPLLNSGKLFENIKANINRFLNSFVPYCIRNFQ